MNLTLRRVRFMGSSDSPIKRTRPSLSLSSQRFDEFEMIENTAMRTDAPAQNLHTPGGRRLSVRLFDRYCIVVYSFIKLTHHLETAWMKGDDACWLFYCKIHLNVLNMSSRFLPSLAHPCLAGTALHADASRLYSYS